MIENLIGLLTATGLSALVGLEREMNLQKTNTSGFGGFRTYSMIGAIGFLAILLEKDYGTKNFSIAVFIAVSILLAVSYFFDNSKNNKIGLTAEFSAITCFLIGALVAYNQIITAISVSILFTLILALKLWLHQVAKNFSQEEFFAILKFLIVAGVILPILPNYTIDPWGIFNPRTIWWMVVLVASIRFVGFFLAKVVGHKKSIILTGTLGGIISSTAVSSSLAGQNKKSPKIVAPFLAGILFANALMFIRVFLEAQIIYPPIAKILAIPLFVMSFSAFVIGLFTFFVKTKKVEQKEEIIKSQPFSLSEAIKFGLFFIVVLVAVKIMPIYFGDVGLYATAIISGLADVDAITLSISNLVANGNITYHVGVNVIFLAVMTNTMVKILIVAIFGGKKLALFVFASLGLVVAIGGITLFFV